jgi:hypothetical protein
MEPGPHLFSCFIGEGDGEDPFGGNPMIKHQVSYSAGQHAGLAAPSPCKNQDRAGVVLDRTALFRI